MSQTWLLYKMQQNVRVAAFILHIELPAGNVTKTTTQRFQRAPVQRATHSLQIAQEVEGFLRESMLLESLWRGLVATQP